MSWYGMGGGYKGPPTWDRGGPGKAGVRGKRSRLVLAVPIGVDGLDA